MASPQFIQTLTGNTSAGTGTFTTAAFAATTGRGNTLIISVADDSGSINQITSITSSAGGSFTQVLSVASTEAFSIWYLPNHTGGASNTITVNYSSVSITNVSVTCQEFNGVLATSPLDKSTSATGTSTAPNSGASAITTKLQELVIGGVGYAAGGGAATLGAGYTNLGNETTNVTLHSAQESKTVGQTAAMTANFTITSAVWLCGVATFYASFASFRPNSIRPHPFSPGLAR